MNTIHTINKLAGNPILDGYAPSNPATQQTKRLHLTEFESLSDYGNAQRFIHHHGNKVFFSPSDDSWKIWEGTVWRDDVHNQVQVLAEKTIRSIPDEARLISDARYRDKLIKWGKSSLSHTRLSQMLKRAAHHLSVSPEQFDTNKMLLGVCNGTVDLKTGKLLQPRQEDMISKQCSVSYNPDAKCPRWLQFNEEIFAGDPDLIRFVQKMVGYLLTGLVSEKCFFLFLGENGDNGKTVFINILMMLLSDYSLNLPMDSLLRRKPGTQSNDIVKLKGARFVSSSEANKQYYFDEALIKRLTGNDPITARALYKEHITFKPEGKIVIGTNQIPRFDREDSAFDKRIRQVPFNVTFVGDAIDTELQDKLMLESEGILTWAVEGCLLWQQEGLGRVPANEPVHYEIGRERSCLDSFVETRCVTGDRLLTRTSELHADYQTYHTSLNLDSEPLDLTQFAIELGKMGFTACHRRDANYRAGISLKSSSGDEISTITEE